MAQDGKAQEGSSGEVVPGDHGTRLIGFGGRRLTRVVRRPARQVQSGTAANEATPFLYDPRQTGPMARERGHPLP